MSYHNNLHEGDRVFLKGKGAATITTKKYKHAIRDSFDFYSSGTYDYRIVYDQPTDAGLVHTSLLTEEDEKYELSKSVTFSKDSGFEIGDTMEIAREGLEPNLRGRLLEVDETAEMWPYRVGQPDGVSVWFGYRELTKIHSIISAQRSGKAKEALKKKIEEARAELEALETALEVLEYAS